MMSTGAGIFAGKPEVSPVFCSWALDFLATTPNIGESRGLGASKQTVTQPQSPVWVASGSYKDQKMIRYGSHNL